MPSPGGWFMCDVIRAGPDYNGAVNIMLTDKANPPVFAVAWFQALTAVNQQMLAVALAAISTGIQVNVNLVSVDAGSEILNLYISKA
jgi:hypothetical protein